MTEVSRIDQAYLDDELVVFSPKDELEKLREKQTSSPLMSDLPDRLPLNRIRKCEALFQPRQIEEKHISDLVRALKSNKALEPVLVIQVGPSAYLIDGHHRIEAYRSAKITEPVPVRYFEGSLDEAVLEAGRANAKAKLPMDTRQRMNYAWRLVLLGEHSKAQIVEAACVSDGQIARMRKAKRELGAAAFDCDEWWRVQRRWQEQEDHQLTDEEQEARIELIAQQQADKMAKAFSSKLANNITVAARTLEIYFGRRLPELVTELQGMVPEDDDLEDDF